MIRILQPTETGLLRQAYNWREDYPSRFRQAVSDGVEQTWDEYLAESEKALDFGLFEDEQMVGLVSLCPAGNGTWAAHISAPRHRFAGDLLHAAMQVRHWMFQHGAKVIYAWVFDRHRALERFCGDLGMKRDGVTALKGFDGHLWGWNRMTVEA